MAEYTFIDPDGVEHHTDNLRAFCKEHGLDSGNMGHLLAGRRTHHRGWTVSAETPRIRLTRKFNALWRINQGVKI